MRLNTYTTTNTSRSAVEEGRVWAVHHRVELYKNMAPPFDNTQNTAAFTWREREGEKEPFFIISITSRNSCDATSRACCVNHNGRTASRRTGCQSFLWEQKRSFICDHGWNELHLRKGKRTDVQGFYSTQRALCDLE